jgi:hypothetical protein
VDGRGERCNRGQSRELIHKGVNSTGREGLIRSVDYRCEGGRVNGD